MLTTIGDKIVEIRPKQIIESNIIIDNDYLVLLGSKRGRPKGVEVEVKKEVKNEEPEPTERSSRDSEAKT